MVAVLTGDIIASRRITDRAGLTAILKEAFALIEKRISKTPRRFELYRGDSFQGVIQDPAKALVTAVIIRARLRSWEAQGPVNVTTRNSKTNFPIPLHLLPDARIGIGIGAVTYRAKRIIESDGEAFHYSGELLDEIKNSGSVLAVRTPWAAANEELAVSTKLLDALIGKWSAPMAEAMYLHFSWGYTQKELSDRIGISQPAVHKRLASASIDAVETCLNRFEKLVASFIV